MTVASATRGRGGGTSAPVLLVLAAGLSTRYGTLKQLEEVGPGGEYLLDYALYDAWRSGFGRAVLVIRPELEDLFRARVRSRWQGRIDFAPQRLEDLPEGVAVSGSRRKPWGTAQAVLAARPWLDEPFAVINADDFYGLSAYGLLGEFLRTAGTGTDFALLGFRLRDTLSSHGGVSRAVCRIDPAGWLMGLEELVDVRHRAGGLSGRVVGGQSRSLTGTEIVSMNMWGFTPAIFPLLAAEFRAFLDRAAEDSTAEFLIPEAVDRIARVGQGRVRVLPADGGWFGMTYAADRLLARERIRQLIRQGAYPRRLFPE